MATEYAQEKALNALGFDDAQQRAANRAANPKSSFVGDVAGGMVTMSPVSTAETVGKQLLQRGAGAAAMGGFEAGGEYLQGEDFDPTRIAMAAAAGAVFPGVNKLGETVQGPTERWLAGRPGRTANPAAGQAHADVGDDTMETAVGDTALAESPPRPTGDTVGTPDENRPTNSRGEVATGAADRAYAKTPASADTSQVTTGDMDPATAAALDAANPAPAPQAQPEAPPPQQRPLGMPPQNFRATPIAPMPAEPVVEAGFPQAGEPVAMGANDTAPMPKDMPAKAQAAIAKSRTAAVPAEATETPPPIKGTAAEPTEGQKEAGNYFKGRTHDFGKPIAIETHTGQTRTGTDANGQPWENVSPYEYGYFNKTVGPDKDHIDFARPADGSPELGDKHFIIDQKNPDTGKYDEPKVFTYVKDQDTAVDLYNRGFSDNSGPSRLHDITEVSRGDLVKYLARHSKSPPKGPYGEPMPKGAKPLADRAVIKDLIAKGKTTPEAIAGLPPEQVEQAIEGKRTRKYGVETGASAGYPVEGIVNSEGKPVTANTKAKAAERSAAHKQMVDWYEKTAPKKENETPGETLDRLRSANNPYAGRSAGWVPSFKPKEWMLAREAQSALRKPTPENVKKFQDAERLLRGNDAAVESYRGSNREAADLALDKRTGSENVASAEGKLQGRNETEDKIIAAIDAKRAGKFDVPHEEAESMVKPVPVKTKADLKELPRKTVNAGDSELAKIDLKKVDNAAAAKRRAEVDALVGKKAVANVPSEERKAGEGKPITITDPEKLKALIEMSNKAAKKRSLSEADLNKEDLTKMPSGKPAYNETARLFDKLREFGENESGAVNVGKIKQDLKNLMGKTTPVKSFIARPPHPKNEPHGDYTRSLSDELHTLDNKNTLHEENILDDFLKKLPKEADQPMLSRIFKAREADSAHVDLPGKQASKTNIESLAPADKKVWDDHIKPMIDEASDFRDTIKAIDPDLAGPDVEHYIARITKGNTPEFNMLRKSDDPVIRRNALAVHASMTNERPFVALENVHTGERHVVQNRPEGGFTIWKNGKATRVKDPNYSFEANQPYQVTNNKTKQTVDYIMRHAMTDEIMNSGARFDLGKVKGKKVTMQAKYYQNAALSAALAHAKLGTMARNIIELARLSSTPEFKDLSTARPTKEQVAAGWKESTMPNFKGTYMSPELREVFDDYAGPGENAFDNLRHLNQAVTKLLFWTPTAHIMNVAAHWFVGRGFDNLNVKRGFETSAKAMQSVVKQDHIQKEMLENGAGLIYPSVRTRKFIEQVAKAVGEKMSEDPKTGWRGVAQQAGVPFKALHDAIYNNSSKVMWAANDMFLTQRYLELKQKGYSPKEAIARAERDIPNYRVPSRFAGSGSKARALSLIAQDNTVFAFSRYHVGMMNAYSDMARGLLGPKSNVADRVEALGKVLALGALAAAYPIADKVAKAVTGNEDAIQNRRGPMSIPYHLNEAAQGREDIASAARTTMTMQPMISTLMEAIYNKDFRGKPVVEPGDLRAAAHGDVRAAGRAAVQEGEHTARGLISPLSTLENTVKKGLNPGEGIRDQVLDQKNPSAAARRWMRKQPINSWRDARTRERHGGSGFLEGAYNRLTK